MPDPLKDKLVIGISTRALFDLSGENDIYEKQGLGAYRTYQKEHEQDTLRPGTGFALVRGLLAISDRTGEPLVEVILLSRNDADSCMRVFNSLEAHGVAVTRGVFRGGRDPWPFLRALKCDLFLSAEPKAVQAALREGTPAGLVLSPPTDPPSQGHQAAAAPHEVRVAFDGDSVLFDEESDRIWREQGAEAFFRHETEHADQPMSPGPFQPFLEGLARVQARFPAGQSPIRTALVTARNAPAHRRVVNTFRAWGINVDEAFFLGGVDKASILELWEPDIVFDDQLANLEKTACHIPSAHVPTGTEQLDLFDASAVKDELASPTKGVPVVLSAARPANARDVMENRGPATSPVEALPASDREAQAVPRQPDR